MKKKILFILNVFLLVSLLNVNFNVKADTRRDANVKVTSYFEDDNKPEVTVTKSYGKKLRLDNAEIPSGYTFAYWLVNGYYYGNLPINYQFTITDNMDIQAIFTPTDKVAALFVDSSGKVLKTQIVDVNTSPSDEDIVLPSKTGYKVATNKWDKPITSLNLNTVFFLQYEINTDKEYILIVNGGSGEDIYSYNAIATVVANTPENKYFHYWTDENNAIVSYEPTYSLTMLQDKELTAVFGDSPITKQPLVTMSEDLAIKDGYRSYLSQFYLPVGYSMVEFGLITSPDSNDNITLETEGITKKQGNKYLPTTNEWVMSYTPTSHNTVRAYLVVEDASESLQTVYSENIKYTITPVAKNPTISGEKDVTLTYGHPNFNPLSGIAASDEIDGDLTSGVSVILKDSKDNQINNPNYSTLAIGDYNLNYVVTNSANLTTTKVVNLKIIAFIELFFSEYGEGSSNNKWLEIYNPNTYDVSLSNYNVRLYANGATTANNTTSLTGTIKSKETYVLSNSSAAADIKNKAQINNAAVCAFNGDDYLELNKNTTIIDVIGIKGNRPTTGWEVAGVTGATADHTLIRKSNKGPNTTFTGDEWIVYSIDYTTGIGTHSYN